MPISLEITKHYMMKLVHCIAIAWTLLSSILVSSSTEILQPQAQIQNGSIVGKYLNDFNQDAYLGIPFAEPPINKLRFQPPKSYNKQWNDARNFTEYGDACIASSGTDSVKLPQSEDCLTLNIVKPHGDYKDLPVAIWIHGGGFADGSSARPAYNTSWIVQNSVEIGKPIIAVSINYRLNGFGFLISDEISQKNWTNIGLRDQIKAIEWVHENIASFGGDPHHLVLWGESAGAISVGKLLNNDELLGSYIKGGIMESGSNVFTNILHGLTKQNQDEFVKLLNHFQCNDVDDGLSCLQKIDFKDLQEAFNVSNGILDKSFGFPYIDNDIIKGSSYKILSKGCSIHKVPILIGTNTDEGSAFVNQTLNTTEQSLQFLQKSYPNLSHDSALKLIDLYFNRNDSHLITPQDPTFNSTPIVYPPSLGSTYPKLATLYGDIMFIAGAKITSKLYAQNEIPVFKYRFNIPDQENSNLTYLGTAHYQEVVYVFNNQGNPMDESDGLKILPSESASIISDTISKIWISFIYDLDPNINDDTKFQTKIPIWPDYQNNQENLVFDINGIYVEKDDFRQEQFNFIEEIIHELDG